MSKTRYGSGTGKKYTTNCSGKNCDHWKIAHPNEVGGDSDSNAKDAFEAYDSKGKEFAYLHCNSNFDDVNSCISELKNKECSLDEASCETDNDCAKNTCAGGTCLWGESEKRVCELSGTTCASDDDCPVADTCEEGSGGSCTGTEGEGCGYTITNNINECYEIITDEDECRKAANSYAIDYIGSGNAGNATPYGCTPVNVQGNTFMYLNTDESQTDCALGNGCACKKYENGCPCKNYDTSSTCSSSSDCTWTTPHYCSLTKGNCTVDTDCPGDKCSCGECEQNVCFDCDDSPKYDGRSDYARECKRCCGNETHCATSACCINQAQSCNIEPWYSTADHPCPGSSKHGGSDEENDLRTPWYDYSDKDQLNVPMTPNSDIAQCGQLYCQQFDASSCNSAPQVKNTNPFHDPGYLDYSDSGANYSHPCVWDGTQCNLLCLSPIDNCENITSASLCERSYVDDDQNGQQTIFREKCTMKSGICSSADLTVQCDLKTKDFYCLL